MENLEYLSDRIGPRLTGSEQLRAAEIWAADVAKQYGLENVHLEGWKIAHSWRRGTAQGQIVEPVVRNLTIASAGWSPGAPGQLRGKLVSVTATSLDELKLYSGKLAGAIVVLEQPSELIQEGPIGNPSSPFNGPSIQTPAPVPDRNAPSRDDRFDSARLTFLKNERAAAIFLDSGKHNTRLTVRNVGNQYQLAAIPTAVVSHEDYLAIIEKRSRRNRIVAH